SHTIASEIWRHIRPLACPQRSILRPTSGGRDKRVGEFRPIQHRPFRGPGLRETTLVACASAWLNPPGVHHRAVFGSRLCLLGPWHLGDRPMPSKSIRTFANAPWGRKRFLLPLPILSILLLGTALASPGVLRMTVNVYE